jgi:hypothetical protein
MQITAVRRTTQTPEKMGTGSSDRNAPPVFRRSGMLAAAVTRRKIGAN